MKKVLAVIAVSILTFLVLAFSVSAASGTCGTSATWTFDETTATLTISGSGSVTSNTWSTYNSQIKNIVVGNSITSLTGGVFKGCVNLEELTVPFIGYSENSSGSSAVLGFPFGYTYADHIERTVSSYEPTLEQLGFGYQYADYYNYTYIAGGHEHEEWYYDTWFYNIPSSLKKVTLTKGTARGFVNSGVTSVVLGEHVTKIAAEAFRSTALLESIEILGTANIAPGAFKGSGVYADTDNWEDGALYVDGHLIEYTNSTATEYTVKEDTRAIAQKAFLNRTNLEKITLPGGINSMTLEVFSGCTSVKEMTIPFGGAYVPQSTEKLTILAGQIFNNTFKGYSNLKEVILASGVTSIGSNAFENCSSLSIITIPKTVTAFGNNVFNSAVTICGEKGSVAEIFAEENNLPFVTCIHSFGDWVTENENKYRECSKCGEVENAVVQGECGEDITWTLDKVTGKLSLNGSGDMYSYADSSAPWILFASTIERVEIEDGITSIGSYAFKNCSLIKDIIVPESVEIIYDGAIDDCLNIAVNGYIGGYAEDYTVRHGFMFKPIDFEDRSGTCGDASWIYYATPGRLIIMGEGNVTADTAWSEFASDVNSIWVADSITSINGGAFKQFSSIEEIRLPFIGKNVDAESYESVFGYIFGYQCVLGWTYYENMHDPLTTHQYIVENYINGELDIDYSDFYCYYIPKTLKKVIFTGTKLPENAFYNCSMLDSLIGINIKTIGTDAFKNVTATVYGHTNTPIYTYAVKNSIPFVAYCTVETGHSCSEKVTAPTCTKEGYTTYTCTNCGYTYKDSYVDKKAHSYEAVVTAPTCTKAGYTTHTCVDCGDSYTDSTVKATGHSYGEWIRNEGYTTSYHKCSVCSTTESRTSSGSLGTNAEWFIDYNTETLYITGEGETVGFTSTTYPDFNSYKAYFKYVVIGEGITGLGVYTFNRNATIVSISFPSTYSTMNDNVFYNCTGLKKVVFPSLSQWLSMDFTTNVNSPMFYGSAALYIGDQIIEELIIPDGVTEIKQYAFAGCSSIKSVVMSNSVTTMGLGAFYKCPSLTDIKFSTGMSAIEGNAFYGCTALEEVVVPAHITKVNYNAFRACSSLKKATIMLSTTAFGSNVFAGCPDLTIYGHSGSRAETYATKNSIDFAIINEETECSHSFTEWEIIDSTCTAKGEKSRECTKCGETETVTIAIKPHDYIKTVTAPTCTEGGYTEYVCFWCDDYYVADETEAAGHKFSEWDIIDSSCTEEGEMSRECQKCGETETKTIAVKQHNYIEYVTEPTCTDDGYTEYCCEWCEDYYTDNVIEATGHSFGEWITDKQPTTTQEGSKSRTCSVCKEVETESIPKLEEETFDAVFTLSSGSVKPGETIKLTLSLKTELEINSVAVSGFTYDSNVLEFVGFGDYEAIEEMSILTAVFDDEKEYILVGFTEPVVFDGDICTLGFKVNENVEDTIATVSATPLVKRSSTVVSSELVPADVTVYKYIKGDIDGDEDVDLDDATFLFGYSMLPDFYETEYPGDMDFDHDGDIDIDDAILLFNYSILPDIFPLD